MKGFALPSVASEVHSFYLYTANLTSNTNNPSFLLMREYLDLVERVLTHGTYKKNRTGIDTISSFAEHYMVDLSKGFPLLTTKKVNFKAMLH
ncbi:MAG TPA: thymidylate synthase, partial [Bacteroidota bacterium]|nr:thymidylate synthase [Bacteroidota bacterium]